jgi:DNA-directed RNA polymerase specialized sigma subunit
MAYRKVKGHIKIPKNRRDERNLEIYQLWLEKRDELTLEDVGNKYGLTRSRICQIIKRQGELALAGEAEK